jgi:FkbM family methyltransferase
VGDRFGVVTDSQAHPDPAVVSGGGEPTPSNSTSRSDVLEQGEDTLGEPEWPAETPGEDSASPGQAPLIGCTIACRGQLPAARVLRDSFLQHHPGARFVVLLLEDPGSAARHDDVEAITPEDIGADAADFARWAFALEAEQLSALYRPRLLISLLADDATVLYLDPSVEVFGRFDDLLSDVGPDRPVALVPRVLRPLFADGLRPNASDLAESGTFDSSVFAVAPGAEEFLEVWAEQVLADPAAGAFLDGAPAQVDHHVLRDPGVGLSVWNASQRELAIATDGRHTVDGAALRSVHFEGFQPQRPWLLSATYADRPRVLLSEHPVLARLCATYRNALIAAGFTGQQAHAFETLPDGTAIPAALRSEYLKAWRDAEKSEEAPPRSPFEPGEDAVDSFLEWASAPADDRQRGAGVCRWTLALWEDDRMLRRDYPDPLGADADAFHEWCAGVGVASGRVPSAAVQRRVDPRRSAMVDQLGVAVVGSGRLAELVRAAVRSSGLPSADTAYYPVVLRCDPDVPIPSGRHLVDVIPDGGVRGGDKPVTEALETWVLSEASRHALRRAGGPQARVISLPLPDVGTVDLPTRKAARARYELSGEFVIGSFVDHVDERRGNVLGLVNAFFQAFPDREEVRLLIGVTGAEQDPEAAERLRLATVTDSRIILVEDDPDTGALFAAADCVASLHRAEGGAGGDHYAMRLLEVAARGIPVLASEHGAVAELLGSHGAKLITCQGGGEPDLDAAAVMLREAADASEEIAEFGASAREHLLNEHSVSRAGERLRDRVENAYRSWRSKWAKNQGQPDDPLRPLLIARHALHRPPDVGDGGRNAMAPALRKAVLKALSHYDHHIRDVMRSLLDGVEQTAAELLRRQSEVDGAGEFDVDAVRAELTQLGRRQDQLDAQCTGVDDGMVRARADLADQHRRLQELEDDLGGETNGHDDRVNTLAERVERLTGAVEKTLDRIDALERKQDESRDQDAETSLRTASRDAAQALHRTDVLQRVLLREHERNTGSHNEGLSAPVLCDAGLLRLPADDSLMLPWLSSHASWDAESSSLIDSLLEPDGVFLDVGAYVGYQTVRVLSRVGPSGTVVAVEPCKRSRELLRRNVEVNVPAAWDDRLTVVDSAAWDSQGDLETEPSLAGGVVVHANHSGETESETVPSVRLDKVLEEGNALNGQSLSVVHVDVGGRVHRVLGGLVRLLRRDRPSIVCSFTPSAIEQMGDDPAAALREFGTWGYDLVPVGRTQAVSPGELLEAIEAAASTSTVKLWLRPKSKGA